MFSFNLLRTKPIYNKVHSRRVRVFYCHFKVFILLLGIILQVTKSPKSYQLCLFHYTDCQLGKMLHTHTLQSVCWQIKIWHVDKLHHRCSHTWAGWPIVLEQHCFRSSYTHRSPLQLWDSPKISCVQSKLAGLKAESEHARLLSNSEQVSSAYPK